MTTLQEAAEVHSKRLEGLEAENIQLHSKLAQLITQFKILEDNYYSLSNSAGRAMDERDYYMRECSELRGKFTAFCAMATEALNTHKMAPFKPNGSPPKDEPATSLAVEPPEDDAIPAFLTKPHEPAKIEGPLKLKRRIMT